MPETNDDLYSRGKYRLEWDRRRDGSLRTPFLQIVWYDTAAGRNRSRSTGASEIGAAEDALDRLYLERERGQAVCSGCGRPFETTIGYPVTSAIADYLLAREDRPSIGAIRPRLAHMLDFLEATGRQDLVCEQFDTATIDEFRTWSAKRPVIEGKTVRQRAPGTTEGSVGALAAAINYAHRRKETPYKAAFTAYRPSEVSRTPTYRSSVHELARMFRYCLYPEPPAGEAWSEKMVARQILYRRDLLRFLQASVATWARPDAVLDISTDPKRDQWIRAASVVQLNPRGRRQTKKYRPSIPVPAKFARLLDQCQGNFIPVNSVRRSFSAMLDYLGLPRERETGPKLIRRSISTIARKRLGEEYWAQGQVMLGHIKASTSDVYALPDPANLGRALSVTEQVIDEIEGLCPGAFTGATPDLRVIVGGKNG